MLAASVARSGMAKAEAEAMTKRRKDRWADLVVEGIAVGVM